MENRTIIFYSSNRENERFEKFITDNLVKNSNGLPIISVTQKPMDLGHNICVGIHDNCYGNEFKQIQIALNKVDTE